MIGEKFIGKDSVALILSDNIFYGNNIQALLAETMNQKSGATVFGYYVNDPKRFGVINFARDGTVISIDEKPDYPKTNFAGTGLYFYDNRVIDIAKSLKPSNRGELEITDINKAYLKWGELSVKLLGQGFAWIDTGTHQSLLKASNYIKTIEEGQNIKVACLEEIAFKKGYISREQLYNLTKSLLKNGYGQYLMRMLHIQDEEKRFGYYSDMFW